MKTVACVGIRVFLVLGGLLSAAAQTFSDRTLDAGIDFVATDGASGQHLFVEFVGRGVGLFDFDNDGLLDVYFANGAPLLPSDEVPPSNRLYRNRGDGTFEDVTERAGVGDPSYSIGVAVGDIDNDGFLDLFVTNFGRNRLYRNRGDGTFEDVTERAGVAAPGFNTGAAFADIDNDGDLDLYIARYAEYTVDEDIPCTKEGVRVYCDPDVYPGASDRLFRNRGDGTFEDITMSSGIGAALPYHGFGVAFGDLNEDGLIDLYVANDQDPNLLFWNEGDGRFFEDALFAGVALSAMGEEEAGMGTALGDYDNDGDLDIIVTNFQKETNSVYRNDGDGLFTDVTASTGVGEASYVPLGWGVTFADFDNDGWKDLFVANGHVQDTIERFDTTTTYRQRNLLLRNDGAGRFLPVDGGAPFRERWPSRGAAFGDLDNDGDLDIVVVNRNDRPNLLINETGNRRSWVRIRLVGRESNRFGVGARVSVAASVLTQTHSVGGGGSYVSHSDLRAFFGLGDAEEIDRLTVRWPSGRLDSFEGLPARREYVVTEGEGIRIDE